MTRASLFLLLTLTLAGCASVPSSVDLPLADPRPTLGQAQQQPDAVSGERVRWGGTIIAVKNTSEHSEVEIIARPLRRSTRPDETQASPGRFLAIIPGFVDPREYEEGKAITVTGRLDGVEIRKVGEFAYRYPRLRAEGHHLWPPEQELRSPPPDPYWYDPWHRPWWHDPWHPYWRPHRW